MREKVYLSFHRTAFVRTHQFNITHGYFKPILTTNCYNQLHDIETNKDLSTDGDWWWDFFFFSIFGFPPFNN